MTGVRIRKIKWCQAMSDWLMFQLEAGKYGLNRETLEPDFNYFEYWFINAEDATAFRIMFSK